MTIYLDTHTHTRALAHTHTHLWVVTPIWVRIDNRSNVFDMPVVLMLLTNARYSFPWMTRFAWPPATWNVIDLTCVCVQCSETQSEGSNKWIFHTCKLKWAFQRFTFDFFPLHCVSLARSFFMPRKTTQCAIWFGHSFLNTIIECVRVVLCELWNYSIKKIRIPLSSGFLLVFNFRHSFDLYMRWQLYINF